MLSRSCLSLTMAPMSETPKENSKATYVDTTGEPTYGQKLVLELTRESVEAIDAANSSLDSRAVRLGSLSTAIATVSGAAKLLPEEFRFDAPVTIVMGLVVCSLIVLICGAQTLKPRPRSRPGSNPTDKLYESYINVTPVAAANRAISQTAMVVQQITEVNELKAIRVRWMLRLIIVQVVLLGLAVMWPYVCPYAYDLFGPAAFGESTCQ